MTALPDSSPTVVTGLARLGNGDSVELATPLQRLVARIVDTAIVLVAVAVLVGGLTYLAGAEDFPFARVFERGSSNGTEATPSAAPASLEPSDTATVEDSDDPVGFTTWELLLFFGGLGVYELTSLRCRNGGWSLGRRLVSVRVVSARGGHRLSWLEAANRWVVLGLGFFVLFVLGGVRTEWYAIAVAVGSGGSILLSAARQGWHDAAAASLVIRTERTWQFFGWLR